jgi:hydroxymethylbilane synthase
MQRVIVGSRGSRLALAQTTLIVALLRERHPGVEFAVEIVHTEGDRTQDRPISQIGDKGVFIRAIERELLNERIDLAVHSLKDVPSDEETPGLELVAFPLRSEARDVLVSRSGCGLADLPLGARVGTGSLRRRVQLHAVRPDLMVKGIRGNVDTRLRKVRADEYDALLLAAAGLQRLGLEDQIAEYLPIDRFVPDAGQGTIVVQARVNSAAGGLARAIDGRESRWAAEAERALVRALQADCHSPVGAHAVIDGERLHLWGMAASEDGEVVCHAQADGLAQDAVSVGRHLGLQLARRLGAAAEPGSARHYTEP